MIGLAVDGIQVENIATTQKTLPDFPGAWQEMLAGTESANSAKSNDENK
jgi:3-phosphoshikimate 1-carboxyvinyltransferase